MTIDAIFESVKKQYENKLPFVLYRKPVEDCLKPINDKLFALLQQDDTLYTIKDWQEKGFVFSPFDNAKDKIILPLDACEIRNCELQVKYEEDYDELPETLTPINELLRTSHINLIKKGIKTIEDKKLKKVVLSRKQKVKVANISTPDSILDVFLRLLKKYPTAFAYCWYHPKVGLWLGATPEILFSLQQKTFRTMALAGTQKMQSNGKYTWGNKEKEEQQMVTHYLEKVLEHYVPILMISKPVTVRAGGVVHLKTDIGGTINNRICNIYTLIEKLHPTPAICGLPKETAKKFIIENEGYDREFYAGYLGELNYDIDPSKSKSSKKTTTLFVNLRCMKVKKNTASIYVGGGITMDSNPKDEWKETVYKAQTILQILS